jgi:hypothetical protein
MIELYFPDLHPNDVVDRFFNPIFQLFPKLVTIQIHGDDGIHELPLSNSEDASKTIQFIKHVYFNNGCVSFTITEESSIASTINMSYTPENNHTVQFPHTAIQNIFALMHPLFARVNQSVYLGDAFGKELGKLFAIESAQEPEITNRILENYRFIEQSAIYIGKINFIPIKDNIVQYSYDTFLPENIQKDELIRLFLFVLSRKLESYQVLKSVQFTDELKLDLSELQQKKRIAFTVPQMHVSGWINPIEKTMCVNLG